MSDLGATQRLELTVGATVKSPRAPFAPDAPGSDHDYVILERLGEGAMGVVYSAWDRALDRRVALKFLNDDQAGDRRVRLSAEAKAMAKVTHPNIITVYDIGEWSDRLYLAMQFVEGETLRHWLREPRTLTAVLDVFQQAGEGLRAVHEAGLVHRDFKPDNVLIDRQGRALVGDFGISSRPLNAVPTVPEGGAMLDGTPAYMAPEQFNELRADAKADQFAFCVALYEALVGTRPWNGQSTRELAAAIGATPVSVPRSAKVPAFVERVLRRGLERDPARRFESMAEVVRALRTGRDQQRKRRGLAVAVATGAAAVAGTGWWVQAHRCSAAPELLAQAWSPAIAERTHAAFNASGLPSAGVMFDRLQRALDAYATGWSRARVDACEATQRGEQSTALLDLRMACLERRRAELAALGELFTHADRRLVERSLEAAANLVSPQTCADTAGLLSVAPLPADERLRQRIQAGHSQLARADAFHAAGRYEDERKVAEPVVAEAKSVGYEPLHAEALFHVGLAHAQRDDTAKALPVLADAALAARAGGLENLEATVEGWLAEELTSAQKFDAAEEHLARAVAIVRHLGPRPRIEAHLEAIRAELAIDQNRPTEALDAYRRAKALWQSDVKKNPIAVVIALLNMSRAQQRLGRGKDALATAEEALALAEAELPPTHRVLAWALDAVARGHTFLGEYTQALPFDDRAQRVLERAYGPDDFDLPKVFMNTAQSLLASGRAAEAVAPAQRAVEILKQHVPNTTQVSNAVSVLGTVYLQLHRFSEAEAAQRGALADYERLRGPDHPRVAVALADLAEVLIAENHLTEAFAAANRAISIFEKQSEPDEVSLAAAYLMRGQSQALADKAVADLERALDFDGRAPNDPLLTGRIKASLALTLLKVAKPDRPRAVALAKDARPAIATFDPELAQTLDRLLTAP